MTKKKNEFQVNIYSHTIEFNGSDAELFICNPDDYESMGSISLLNFVPDDYNVVERMITINHDLPDWEEVVDEDVSVDDWWNSLHKDDKIDLLNKAISDRMKNPPTSKDKEDFDFALFHKDFELNVNVTLLD